MSETDKATLRRADMENMISALKGVSSDALSEAVEMVMRRALGHDFMPQPPEFRGLCDRIMKPILDARRAEMGIQRHAERQREERKQREEIQSSWTPESRARATAKWEATKAQRRLDDAKQEVSKDGYDTSREASLARLKAGAEENGETFDFCGLKSAASNTFIQIGKAA